MITAYLRRLADSRLFNNFVLGVIVFAGILVGIETYQTAPSPFNWVLEFLDFLVLLVFTVEFLVKITAEGAHPWRYFRDAWNVFDFSIVVICWLAYVMPEIDAGFVAVIRLARVLRVLRLVHAFPQLKLLVNALLKSIPSMGYVGVLLLLLYYIYGAMGVFLFRENDPLHFGNLTTAMLSLFRISTLEGWTEIMYINMFGCDNPKWGYGPESGCITPEGKPTTAVLFFISFVLIGTMIVLNLFIGVIMNSMDEVRAEQAMEELHSRRLSGELQHLEDEITEMHNQLDGIKKQLDFIAFRLRKEEKV